MGLTRNAKGGYKVSTKAPRRRKRMYDGRCYEDAQPWHPNSPRVRVRLALLVPRALFTALCALSRHEGRITGPTQTPGICQDCTPQDAWGVPLKVPIDGLEVE